MKATMRRSGRQLVVVASACVLSGCGSDAVHWGYEGEAGPAHWAQLSAEYTVCGTGTMQSPIDIVNPEDVDLPPLELDYHGRVTGIINSGHAVQLEVEPDNRLQVDGRRSTLAQVHFHSPSEHRIAGERFPLEAHFVHRDDAGGLAVLAMLFREGDPDAGLTALGTPLPRPGDAARPLNLALSNLGPSVDDRSYYRYDGSLTTPPCTEGVRWYVLRSVRTLAPDQLSAFTRAAHANARDTQPLHSRLVQQ